MVFSGNQWQDTGQWINKFAEVTVGCHSQMSQEDQVLLNARPDVMLSRPALIFVAPLHTAGSGILFEVDLKALHPNCNRS